MIWCISYRRCIRICTAVRKNTTCQKNSVTLIKILMVNRSIRVSSRIRINFWIDWLKMWNRLAKKMVILISWNAYVKWRPCLSMNVVSVKIGSTKFRITIVACCRSRNRIVWHKVWRSLIRFSKSKAILVIIVRRRLRKLARRPISTNCQK